MSFFKQLLANWFGGNYYGDHHGSKHGYYNKHAPNNIFNPSSNAPLNQQSIVSPDQLRTCLKCGAVNAKDAKFCTQCGNTLSNTSSVCSGCNQPIAAGDKFCKQCGKAQ